MKICCHGNCFQEVVHDFWGKFAKMGPLACFPAVPRSKPRSLLPGPQLASFFQVPREVFCWDFSGPLLEECKSHRDAPWTRPSLTQVPSTARGPRSLSCEVAGPAWRACQAPVLCIQARSSPPGLTRLLTHLPVLRVQLPRHPRCPVITSPLPANLDSGG